MRHSIKAYSFKDLGLVLAFAASISTATAQTAGLETVTVNATPEAAGAGLITTETTPKTVSSVSADFVAAQAPTENAFQLVSLLPGANVSMSDAYGLSSQNSLTLRGLSQSEIGYVMEGAPQNDIGSYSAYPSQFVDAENIRQITLSQGTVDLDSPVINATGGLVDITLKDPSETPGGFADFSYGSYHATRGFIRLDTGLLGDSGVRAFVSYSQIGADNDRGFGRDTKQHVDAKAVKEWGEGNRVALALSYNDAITSGYPEPALADWAALHRSYNYDGSYAGQDPYYWKLYQNTFRNLYVSAPTLLHLADDLTLDTTAYAQTGYGNSPGGTTLTTTGNFQGTQPIVGALNIPGAVNGTATVMSDYTGEQFRSGVVSSLHYTLGAQTLTAGFWYDYADDKDQQPFTPVGANGEPSTIWAYPSSTIKLPNGETLLATDDHTVTQVEAAFVGDHLSLLEDRLGVELGFKGVYVSRDGTNGLPGPQRDVSVNDFQPLPRASVQYKIDEASQLYADVSTNFQSPNEYALYNGYYGGSIYGVGNPYLKDEYSIAEEIGYRFHDTRWTANVSVFNYNFSNRQIATIVNQNGALVSDTVNGGAETSRGVDAEIGTQPIDGFSPYVSAEYLHATTDNNLRVDTGVASQPTDYLPTAGKIAVRSPEVQAAIGLNYDNGGVFGNFQLKYTGRQFSSFMDDEKIPDFAQLDAAFGYHLPALGLAKPAEIRLNLINLTDAHFLSGVANPTPNAQNQTGTRGTVIAGAAPSYYIGPGFAALLTLSAGF